MNMLRGKSLVDVAQVDPLCMDAASSWVLGAIIEGQKAIREYPK